MKTTLQKMLALLCCACLLLGMCACSKDASTEVNAAVPAGTAAAADGMPTPAPARDEAKEGLAVSGKTEALYGDVEVPAGAAPEYAGEMPAAVEDGEGDGPVDAPPIASEPMQPSSFVLTAAEWNDNDNWPFFTNLVNAQTIAFPVYGVDPRYRIKVTLTDEAGNPLNGETVSLKNGDLVMWTAQSDKNGVAYLFYSDETEPTDVWVGGKTQPIPQKEESGDAQNPGVMRPANELTFTVAATAPAKTDLQVMFIVDTTGSMGDELAYLQKDFASIAEDVGTDGVSYSVNFYRDEGDEYVTKCSAFSSDIDAVRSQINSEYADGGGDTPEAVAEILSETLTVGEHWNDSSEKLAFLIFDAPPHDGKEKILQDAVKAAAQKGIRVVPVGASNADRETELFGRALAICTGGTYVFLTDDSGVGLSHLEPIVGDYKVELLHDLIVRIITEHKPA